MTSFYARAIVDYDDHGRVISVFLCDIDREAFDRLHGKTRVSGTTTYKWLRKGQPVISGYTNQPPHVAVPLPVACGEPAMTLAEAVASAEAEVREGFDVHLERDADGARFVSTIAGVSQ